MSSEEGSEVHDEVDVEEKDEEEEFGEEESGDFEENDEEEENIEYRPQDKKITVQKVACSLPLVSSFLEQ